MSERVLCKGRSVDTGLFPLCTLSTPRCRYDLGSIGCHRRKQVPPLLLNRLVVTRYPLALSDAIHPHTRAHRKGTSASSQVHFTVASWKPLKSYCRTVRAAEIIKVSKRHKDQRANFVVQIQNVQGALAASVLIFSVNA